jgi:hypothetical protein
MTKALLLVLALLLGAVAVPSDAHAACLTGSALDTYAMNWFDSWEWSHGVEVHCGLECSGNVNFVCAHGTEPIYWQGRGAFGKTCGGTSTSKNYDVWIHPTSWIASGNTIQCFCYIGSTFCQMWP